MKNPIQNKMNTVFIHVSNLEEGAAWYTNLLGQVLNTEEICLPVFTLDVEGHTGITLDAGPDGDKPLSPSPHPLFNLHTDDIQAAYEHAEKLNCTMDSKIITFDHFSSFTIQDPDGNIIMICTG